MLVHAVVRNLPRIVARNFSAASLGIGVGMPLAEADSLLHAAHPLIAPFEPEADLAELRRLAGLCGRFGPIAGIEQAERPEAVLVDVTGCSSFFRGEEALAREAIACLRAEGYAARAGLGDTVGLAWAAARAEGTARVSVIATGDGESWLSRRPVSLLRLDTATISALANLGLRTVGDVLRLPRAELPSRFGPGLLRRIDQALGRIPEPVEGLRHAEPLSADWWSEFPLTDRTSVEHVCGQLLDGPLSRLARWEGVAALACRFGSQPGPTVRPATPSRSAERLLVLLRLAFDRQPPPREVSSVVLTVETACLPSPLRTSLFAEEQDTVEKQRAAQRLLERLCSRLGADAVQGPAFTGDPRPEHAVQWQPVGQTPAATTVLPEEEVWAAGSRPVLLFDPPELVQVWSIVPDGPPFRIARGGKVSGLTIALGPERLEAGWADAPEAQRDYWRCEAEQGERLWLFRCRRSGAWFLHGLFA